MHNEDGNGNIIPDANGCTFKYIEDDEKGRHIKIRFLNEDKRPMADKDGIFGQEYKYEDDRHIIEITCIGESGLPINNNQGYCIVHVFKDENNRESKRMYFDIDGTPAKVNLLLGCNGLSYEYPNEYTIITGYLNEHGNISINRHGYAYCEEYTNPQTGTRKIFYYDEDRNNTISFCGILASFSMCHIIMNVWNNVQIDMRRMNTINALNVKLSMIINV